MQFFILSILCVLFTKICCQNFSSIFGNVRRKRQADRGSVGFDPDEWRHRILLRTGRPRVSNVHANNELRNLVQRVEGRDRRRGDSENLRFLPQLSVTTHFQGRPIQRRISGDVIERQAAIDHGYMGRIQNQLRREWDMQVDLNEHYRPGRNRPFGDILPRRSAPSAGVGLRPLGPSRSESLLLVPAVQVLNPSFERHINEANLNHQRRKLSEENKMRRRQRRIDAILAERNVQQQRLEDQRIGDSSSSFDSQASRHPPRSRRAQNQLQHADYASSISSPSSSVSQWSSKSLSPVTTYPSSSLTSSLPSLPSYRSGPPSYGSSSQSSIHRWDKSPFKWASWSTLSTTNPESLSTSSIPSQDSSSFSRPSPASSSQSSPTLSRQSSIKPGDISSSSHSSNGRPQSLSFSSNPSQASNQPSPAVSSYKPSPALSRQSSINPASNGQRQSIRPPLSASFEELYFSPSASQYIAENAVRPRPFPVDRSLQQSPRISQPPPPPPAPNVPPTARGRGGIRNRFRNLRQNIGQRFRRFFGRKK